MAQRRKPTWDSNSVLALRRHLGFTQQQLAEELSMRQQTISEWETGQYEPRGASATLLSIIADRSDFSYEAAPHEEETR
jgi:DNA-binding transcriptional regulator YiaG